MGGKFVPLNVDVATCRDRPILGVNLLSKSDGKIQLSTLAMKELTENHPGLHLITVLDEVIKQYEIKSNQIYSLRDDNGANMLKCVRLFSEEDITKRTVNVEQSSCSSWQNDAQLVNDKDDSETVNRINVEVFLGNLSFWLTITAQAENIRKFVRCAAHTQELAIKDALKEFLYTMS